MGTIPLLYDAENVGYSDVRLLREVIGIRVLFHEISFIGNHEHDDLAPKFTKTI